MRLLVSSLLLWNRKNYHEIICGIHRLVVWSVFCNAFCSHSYGEYVFDHSWASAYFRYGGSYYPKLQCCVPFTPATGPRILVRGGPNRDQVFDGLCKAMQQLTDQVHHLDFDGLMWVDDDRERCLFCLLEDHCWDSYILHLVVLTSIDLQHTASSWVSPKPKALKFAFSGGVGSSGDM